MRSIDLSNGDFQTLMRWIGQRCANPTARGLRAENLERKATLVLRKINKKYGTE